MAFSLAWLAEVLEDAGLKVAEQPGWRSRGRGEKHRQGRHVPPHCRIGQGRHAKP
jgi:hypothetical protein